MATINAFEFISKKNITITIRNCEERDLEQMHPFLTQIAKESTHTMMAEGRELKPIESIKARWHGLKMSEKGLALAAFDGKKIIGQLFLGQDWGDHPWINHCASFGMFILQEYWGQGVGKELLNMMDKHARTVNLTRIEGHVRAKNDRGITLYLKSGFKIEGLRKNAAFINNEFQDEYYLGRIYGN